MEWREEEEKEVWGGGRRERILYGVVREHKNFRLFLR